MVSIKEVFSYSQKTGKYLIGYRGDNVISKSDLNGIESGFAYILTYDEDLIDEVRKNLSNLSDKSDDWIKTNLAFVGLAYITKDTVYMLKRLKPHYQTHCLDIITNPIQDIQTFNLPSDISEDIKALAGEAKYYGINTKGIEQEDGTVIYQANPDRQIICVNTIEGLAELVHTIMLVGNVDHTMQGFINSIFNEINKAYIWSKHALNVRYTIIDKDGNKLRSIDDKTDRPLGSKIYQGCLEDIDAKYYVSLYIEGTTAESILYFRMTKDEIKEYDVTKLSNTPFTIEDITFSDNTEVNITKNTYLDWVLTSIVPKYVKFIIEK